MGNSSKTIIILGVILALAMVALAYLSPKVVDWRPTYNTKDRIPMGLYVLDQEIESLTGTWVDRVKIPLKDLFYEGVFYEEDSGMDGSALLFINQENNWNTKEVDKVCTFVYRGSTAFVSSIKLPPSLMEVLNINVSAHQFDPLFRRFADTISLYLGDSITPKIVDKNGVTGSFFTSYDSLKSIPLGYVGKDSIKSVNFLKIRHGSGHFLVHLEPAVFTNYHLLKKDHHQYAEGAFYHLPADDYILWTLDNQTSQVISDSPLRFILSQPSLRWAWYLLLVGIAMFVIFNIRRSQRAIPIIPKPTNTSVEFVKTIGNLYFMEGDIRSMMDKKIVYLLAKIRNEYHLSTDVLDDKFVQLLQMKSGKDEKITQKMIFLVNKHREHDYKCTLDDLNRLNTSIEHFYQK